MARRSYRPRSRHDGILVEDLEAELVVCDTDNDSAHVLNETAAKVWLACDGERDLEALKAHCDLDEVTLELTLDCLRSCRLLDEPATSARLSRRTVLGRAAVATAGLGAALPVIQSVVLPTPAMALSVVVVTTTVTTTGTTSTTTTTTSTTRAGTTVTSSALPIP
jgi:hypothetical protein